MVGTCATSPMADQTDVLVALHREWLATRGTKTDALSEAEIGALDDRIAELARRIMMTPADVDWCIGLKFEVLEAALSGNAVNPNPDWTDRRLFAFLGCLKADVLRHLG